MVKTIPPWVRVVKSETKVRMRANKKHLTKILMTSPHRNTDETAHRRRVSRMIKAP